jgi:sensor domain CHASE-containing protein
MKDALQSMALLERKVRLLPMLVGFVVVVVVVVVVVAQSDS